MARTICIWTDKLPEDCRLAADAILIVAAKTGAGPRDLAEVFGGIYTLSRPRPRLVPAAEARDHKRNSNLSHATNPEPENCARRLLAARFGRFSRDGLSPLTTG